STSSQRWRTCSRCGAAATSSTRSRRSTSRATTRAASAMPGTGFAETAPDRRPPDAVPATVDAVAPRWYRATRRPDHANPPPDAPGRRSRALAPLLLRRPRHAAPPPARLPRRPVHARVRRVWQRGGVRGPRADPQLGYRPLRDRHRLRPRRPRRRRRLPPLRGAPAEGRPDRARAGTDEAR